MQDSIEEGQAQAGGEQRWGLKWWERLGEKSAGVALWRLCALKWSYRKLTRLTEIKYTKLILCYVKSVTSLTAHVSMKVNCHSSSFH
jgi:hypothetical protein